MILTNFPFGWFSEQDDVKLVYESLEWAVKHENSEDNMEKDTNIKNKSTLGASENVNLPENLPEFGIKSKTPNEKVHLDHTKDITFSDIKKKNSVTSVVTLDLNKKKFTVNQIIAEFILTVSRYATLDFSKELIVIMA